MQIVVTVLLKVAKIRSIIGNRIYYNGVEVLKARGTYSAKVDPTSFPLPSLLRESVCAECEVYSL